MTHTPPLGSPPLPPAAPWTIDQFIAAAAVVDGLADALDVEPDAHMTLDEWRSRIAERIGEMTIAAAR